MIAPTLATVIDANVAEAAEFVDPTQNGEDERMCFCDTAVCRCAVPLNGIIVTLSRSKVTTLDDLPF